MESDSNLWESYAWQRIQETLVAGASTSNASQAQRNYAVFDFDNTLCYFDVEDHLMMYLVDAFKIGLTCQELLAILTNDNYSLQSHPLSPNHSATVHDLALDIVDLYEALVTIPVDFTTPLFQSFSAKIRYYYQFVKKHIPPLVGKPWLTYWFGAYTLTEFNELVDQMLAYYSQQPIQYRQWSSHPAHSGRTGILEADFEQGIRISTEMVELIQQFHKYYIETYIISASPKILVEQAAKYYQLPISANHIFGKEIQIQANGKLTAVLIEGSYLTKYQGKVQVIEAEIRPNHEGKQPLFIAGDSNGDYNMLSQYAEMQLGLIIHRPSQGPINQLIEAANQNYNNQAKYVVQGRNEKITTFIPQTQSILLK